MAVYPASIKQFTTKRDVYDVNYAADINALQDEVRALQMVLGINPQVANLNSGSVYYQDIASRLDSIEKGEGTLGAQVTGILNAPPPPPPKASTSVLTCSVYNPYLVIPASDGVLANANWGAWDTAPLTLGVAQADGTGITIQRSGFYQVEATGRWGNPPGGSSIQMMSVREGSYNEIVGSFEVIQHFPGGIINGPGALRTSASGICRLTTGTPLRVWLFNQSTIPVPFYNLSLTTYFLSEG
jgi:hypothetical protein